MTGADDSSRLDARVAELSAEYLDLAVAILQEAIRIPADYVDRPIDDGGDPLCGLSNHERPRVEFLKQTIIDVGAVRRPEDVAFDDYGNLVWSVSDPEDGIHPDVKKVVYLDGHTDMSRRCDRRGGTSSAASTPMTAWSTSPPSIGTS